MRLDKEHRRSEPIEDLGAEHLSDPGYRAVTAIPGLVNLLVSSVCARTGSRTYAILLVLFVLHTYHSASLSGLIVLTGQVPGMLISPIAGALLDRRGRVGLIRTDFLVASCAISLVTLLSFLHLLPLWALFTIVAGASFTQPLSSTGTRSLFPLIVPRPLWDRANGLDGSTFVVATVFGPMLAGFGFALLGARDALFLPVALYLVAAGVLIGVKAPPAIRSTTRVLSDAWGALRYVFSNKTLRQLATTVTIYNAGVGSMSVAVPVLVIDHLHGGSTTTGLMLATLGLGGSISSIAMGAIGTAGREHHLMAGSCLVAGASIGLLAIVSHDEPLAFAALLIIGLTNGPLNITMFTVRQRVTDPEWFGRAFAISMSLNGAGIPIGAAVVGAVISHSVVAAFLIAGICTLSAGLWPILFPFEVHEPAPSFGRDVAEAGEAPLAGRDSA